MESKPTFLVIEDNLIDQYVTRQLLKKVLEVDDVSVVNNGKEGILWLNEHPDISSLIILLDIQMPVMNGFEFLKEYNKLETIVKRETRIYVLSSTLDSDDIKLVKENCCVTAFFNKPFPIDKFKQTIFQHS
ncbi:response regulator [Flavobacterium sp. GA093]|uniref:Response regulator n=1 Tax=Flavobacterium hydrocarbonoxydans TaxID=2683249 RepID=A0A6I4NKX5_9FLAO|nr:response regulator [Flavobacterium hydrocarbonoxydans]MWB95050.1 response regulator [Flavobacterium hydrocarbonoxydans]